MQYFAVTEKGNVLFLILIAVVLFAALSFAVTQSSRTSPENTSHEKLAMQYAQVMQQAAIVRSSIQRMQIMKGTALTDIQFLKNPSDFTEGLCNTGTLCLFTAENGWAAPTGIPPGIADTELMASIGIPAAGIDLMKSTYLILTSDILASPATDIAFAIYAPKHTFCDYVHKRENLPAIDYSNLSGPSRVPTQCASLYPIGLVFMTAVAER